MAKPNSKINIALVIFLVCVSATLSVSAKSTKTPSKTSLEFSLSKYPYAVKVNVQGKKDPIEMALALHTGNAFYSIDNNTLFKDISCKSSSKDEDSDEDECQFDKKESGTFIGTTYEADGFQSPTHSQLLSTDDTTDFFIKGQSRVFMADDVSGRFRDKQEVTGAFGLGFDGAAFNDFDFASNFMIDLKADEKEGKLVINQDPYDRSKLVATLNPITSNWHTDLKSVSLEANYHPLGAEKVVFDITVPYLAFPEEYFSAFRNEIVKHEALDCDKKKMDSDKDLIEEAYLCRFTDDGDFDNLPSIKVYTEQAESIQLSPKDYLASYDDGNEDDQVYKLLIIGTTDDKDHEDTSLLRVSKSYNTSVIVGSVFFERYNAIFDFSDKDKSQIFVYDPKVEGSGIQYLVFIIIGSAIFIGIGIILCCIRPKFRRDSAIDKPAQQSYYKPPDFVMSHNDNNKNILIQQNIDRYDGKLSVISEKDDEASFSQNKTIGQRVKIGY